MNPIGSNSFAAQIYNSIQTRFSQDQTRTNARSQGSAANTSSSDFKLPASATPQGDWVLSENASPQNFDPNSQRGSYLNIVV
jgi:hypothetical protein